MAAGIGSWFRRRPQIPPELWRRVESAVPWRHRFDAERRQRWRPLTEFFLQKKTISPVGGLTLSEFDVVLLAGLCTLPVLELGGEGLRGWTEVIVYPDAFQVRTHEIDEAGVVHEEDDCLVGEAWEAGPLILSWRDILHDLERPDAGHCVVVHEMAHKLDALDGTVDGAPPLTRNWARRWAHDFSTAYADFCAAFDAGGEESPIDLYAAQAPEEFFAVLSEYHFSQPGIVLAAMPQVFTHLTRFYGTLTSFE